MIEEKDEKKEVPKNAFDFSSFKPAAGLLPYALLFEKMVIPIFQTDPGHPDYIAQNYGCQAFDEAPVF